MRQTFQYSLLLNKSHHLEAKVGISLKYASEKYNRLYFVGFFFFFEGMGVSLVCPCLGKRHFILNGNKK